MNPDQPIELRLPRHIDLTVAQDIVCRIRSVMRNGGRHLALRFAEGTNLGSSEFLGYLVSVARHLREAGGTLELVDVDAGNRRILEMMKLDSLVTIRTATGEVAGKASP